jgi:hypothetical protein
MWFNYSHGEELHIVNTIHCGTYWSMLLGLLLECLPLGLFRKKINLACSFFAI